MEKRQKKAETRFIHSSTPGREGTEGSYLGKRGAYPGQIPTPCSRRKKKTTQENEAKSITLLNIPEEQQTDHLSRGAS